MKSVLTNKQIFLYIFVCQLCHYGILYAVGSVIYAIYSLQDFDGTIPFDFQRWMNYDRCCNYTSNEMVNTLTMFIGYPISGVAFGALISVRVWDFAVTTTLLHIALSCLVMLDAPTNWSWWVTLGCGCILMVACGEGVAAVKHYRNIARLVVPEKQASIEQPVNYLHR